MRKVECYVTFDGKHFDDFDKAKSHDEDLIAEEIEDFVSHLLKLDCSHRSKVNGIIRAISVEKGHLKRIVDKLYEYLNEDEVLE